MYTHDPAVLRRCPDTGPLARESASVLNAFVSDRGGAYGLAVSPEQVSRALADAQVEQRGTLSRLRSQVSQVTGRRAWYRRLLGTSRSADTQRDVVALARDLTDAKSAAMSNLSSVEQMCDIMSADLERRLDVMRVVADVVERDALGHRSAVTGALASASERHRDAQNLVAAVRLERDGLRREFAELSLLVSDLSPAAEVGDERG